MDPRKQNEWKQAAAEEAAKLVENGMVLGIGTGSTAAFFIEALAQRISREGLRVAGIPTSEETAEHARRLNIPLTSFADHTQIDMTVDGADEVQVETLFLIKGHGGALLREKIVASAARSFIVVADSTKLVSVLGKFPLPVEVIKMALPLVQPRLAALGLNPKLRMANRRKPVPYRRRELHSGLRLWPDRRAGGNGGRDSRHRRRGGARAVSRDGVAGADCWG